MTSEKWRDLQSSIKLTIGNNNYRTWIDPLNFSHVEDDIAVFDVPTTFLGNYVEQNFGDVILHKLSEAQRRSAAFDFKLPRAKPISKSRWTHRHAKTRQNPALQ